MADRHDDRYDDRHDDRDGDGDGGRERHADLIRAVGIGAVVLGHWSVMAVTRADGTIDGVNALGRLPALHPATWLFQVMPLFFFVGGLANATSWRRHHGLGGDAPSWVVRRFRRLLVPAALLLGALIGAVVAGRAAGVDPEQLGTAAWVATVPLWFLAAYLALVVLTPLAVAAHRRWGLVVPAAATGAVALVDLARFHAGEPWFVDVNYVLAWLGIHQLGFAWQDGRLPARPAIGSVLLVGGVAALLALTVAGPYPLSMVTVPGVDLQNTEPPSLALLALASAHIGVALATRDAATRWLRAHRRRRVVSAVQSKVLTVFLWHMAAAVVAAVALYGTGALPVEPIGTDAWVRQRLPWLAGCSVVLAGLLAVAGPVERPATRPARGARSRHRAAAAAGVAGAGAAVAGMVLIASSGPGVHGPAALPTPALASFAVGIALLAAHRADVPREAAM